jgi:hypothetical protein
MEEISTYEQGRLVDFQFQRVIFTRDFWTNKSELDKGINMKFVHYHAKNKSVQMVYLEAQRIVQKLHVKRASQN